MYQLISFLSTPHPSVMFWNGDELGSAKLSGVIHTSFSEDQHCIGHNDGHGRHKCAHSSKGTHQCIHCKHKDISKVYTRLDFSGFEWMAAKMMNERYSIYLAYFGAGMLKCGVTRSERVEKRLLEQGADYWAELMHFNNAEDAYQMERLLQDMFGLRNSVTPDKKIKSMGQFDENEIKAKIDELKVEPFSEYLLDKITICRNDFGFELPKRFAVSEAIDGNITGAKGEFLFYENDFGHFALNMRKKTGRFFKI